MKRYNVIEHLNHPSSQCFHSDCVFEMQILFIAAKLTLLQLNSKKKLKTCKYQRTPIFSRHIYPIYF